MKYPEISTKLQMPVNGLKMNNRSAVINLYLKKKEFVKCAAHKTVPLCSPAQ
jgi:hypothetical protein